MMVWRGETEVAMPRSKIPPTNVERMVRTANESGATLASRARSAELSLDRIERAVMIPRSRLKGMENQPRREIPEDGALHELARSIAAEGLLQPLVARADPDDPGSYILIAGHRRVAATDLLTRDAVDLLADDEDEIPLAERNAVRAERQRRAREIARDLPVLLRDVDTDTAYALALVENLQRENLSAREVMQAVVELQDRFGWSLGQIARNTHRNRGGLSVLARVARYPDLAALVEEGRAAPSTAGLLVSLSAEERAPFVARIHSGEITTIDQVESALRAYRAARRRPVRDSEAESGEMGDGAELDANEADDRDEVFKLKHRAVPREGDIDPADRPPGRLDGDAQPFKFKHPVAREKEDAAGVDRGVDADAAAPDVAPAGVPERTTTVGEHVRRLGASSGGRSDRDLTVERLCADLISFLATRPMLDRGSQGKLAETSDAIQDYLNARRR